MASAACCAAAPGRNRQRLSDLDRPLPVDLTLTATPYMKATRRPRSDSAHAAIEATQAAAMPPLEPPAHVTLRPCDRPYWAEIMQARSRASWNGVDMAQAAVMARAQADIARLQIEVDSEGDTVTAANGCPVLNPKVRLVEMLARRVLSTAAAIHVHTLASTGRPEDAAKGNQLERQARERDDDDLIPTLRVV